MFNIIKDLTSYIIFILTHSLASYLPLEIIRHIIYFYARGIGNATKIICGKNHYGFLIDHSLYMVGSNKYGQLGFYGNNAYKPIKIKPNDIIDANCGWTDHTVFITNSGDVYCCGYNFDDKFHLGTHSLRLLLHKHPIIKNIKMVSSNNKYCIFLTTDGNIVGYELYDRFRYNIETISC